MDNKRWWLGFKLQNSIELNANGSDDSLGEVIPTIENLVDYETLRNQSDMPRYYEVIFIPYRLPQRRWSSNPWWIWISLKGFGNISKPNKQ